MAGPSNDKKLVSREIRFLSELVIAEPTRATSIFAKKFRELAVFQNQLELSEAEALERHLTEYRHKNRYASNVPYDNSRVCLRKNNDHCDYINASYLQYPSDNFTYIATQAPIPDTFGDFWWMVWQEKVSMIVALVMIERNRCDQYWPNREGQIKCGPLIITWLSEAPSADANFLISEFSVSEPRTKETRIVHHYHYKTWPDRSIPDDPKPLYQFYHLIWQDAQYYQSPVVVHCSAGVGRTGTFCTIDTTIRMLAQEHFRDRPEDLVFEIIKMFRTQRGDIVSTRVTRVYK